MTRSVCICLVTLLVAAPAAMGDQKGRSTYRWIDERGVVHYGDNVPPEYTTRERAVLNSQGIEIGRLEAQKTPQQLAEEARRAEEQQRIRQRDRFLLSTYTSVKDIEHLRDTRVQQIADQQRSTRNYIDTLNGRLGGLHARALTFRPYNASESAGPMPDQLADDLVRTLNELRVQNALLDTKSREIDALRTQFQTDIDRYRQLRSGSVAATAR
jgi:hypothetical protein